MRLREERRETQVKTVRLRRQMGTYTPTEISRLFSTEGKDTEAETSDTVKGREIRQLPLTRLAIRM
jgi:hypothetical protein